MERKRIISFAAVSAICVVASLVVFRFLSVPSSQPISESEGTSSDPAAQEAIPEPSSPTVRMDSAGFVAPLVRAGERVTKKPFGIYVTPKTSPVRPERFTGYHTGADFEIFPEEADTDVAVSAVCDGKLLDKRYASGYGGVVVESCEYDGAPITVVYGHLRLSSVPVSVGKVFRAGDFLGNLGTGYSSETDGERKHLHLGIHRGVAENVRGYVAAQAELSEWVDPCILVCHL
ncbi:MAG: M23 family metallopeptidase [Candidatus Moranbacteria bacterium]|nr:M23 family metallopeptidase [Candidatus Moranbacteria bacterium]